MQPPKSFMKRFDPISLSVLIEVYFIPKWKRNIVSLGQLEEGLQDTK
jgi:hypothetical protein